MMMHKETGGDIGVCRGCGKLIVWVVMESGKRMPVDPNPSPIGNIVCTKGVGKQVPTPAEDARLSHFATCPQADRFKKSQGAKDEPRRVRR